MSVPAMQMESTMTLARLLEGMATAPEIAVRGIASDSRKLGPGFLFLACKGIGGHGLDYLDQAYEAGVCAVAWDSSSANAPADRGVQAWRNCKSILRPSVESAENCRNYRD